MDNELRIAIRALQRAGLNLSYLNLHEIMNHDQLSELIHQAIIARLRLLNCQFQLIINPKDSRMSFDSFWHIISSDEPRLFLKKRWKIGTFITKQIPQSLEELSPLLTKSIYANWDSVLAARVPIKQDVAFEGLGIYANDLDRDRGDNQVMTYYLVEVWKDSPEEFKKFRDKKLKEMGIIPGRLWDASLETQKTTARRRNHKSRH